MGLEPEDFYFSLQLHTREMCFYLLCFPSLGLVAAVGTLTVDAYATSYYSWSHSKNNNSLQRVVVMWKSTCMSWQPGIILATAVP
ncbi:unnamed protein product [Prunus brigantina]